MPFFAPGLINMNEWLRRPPSHALAVSLLMLAFGTLVGAMLVSFQDIFYAAARREIIKRPEIHGFSGSEVIDQGRIAEVADQANAALRLLHTHSIGVGILCVVSLGAVYPLGWGVLALLIPFTGADVLRGPVQWTFFVPFGGALITGLIGAIIMLFIGLLWRSPKRGSEP
jgi:hypothetical protein